MAVVEVEPERDRLELVDGGLSGSTFPAPRPGTPSITSRWMPWKCMVCGWLEPFVKRTRSRSPSRARSVGPGTRPL